ncbi:GntR family transcriptional regulator [Fusobacterium ulcerans]|uniref:GntR family transcriptional regulator n=1 Tax=Fusobacterium ulcerans TaxID=861 RepID=UPI001D0ACBBD|nr:GntR family transcriptional regulator [Fusobacterium ulcerans]MCB8566081.1 GntR family transcriptional regulator [Fusobacterium ulcerans]MCB8650989.1 GntR family transcriptional regulator [Fusobacterium ulcerans]
MEPKIDTIRERVTKEIRHLILMGKFKPGKKMLETTIAQELNVSRNPVREALRQLEQEGIVEYIPQKGCFLREINLEELEEIFRLRANLEVISLEYCNFKMSDETIRKLESIIIELSNIKKSKKFDDMFILGLKFHELIVQECGKNIIYKTWKNFEGYNYSIFLNIYDSDIDSLKRNILTHKKLLEKLRTGKENLIKKAILQHYLEEL